MPALAVYAISLAVYALTCGAAVGWLDAPELVAAASSLGIPHSPGHPLVVMLGKIATLLPIGDIPFRVALASGLAAAGAATLFFYLTRSIIAAIVFGNERQSSSRSIDGMALAAALVLAFSWALWFQGVRAEVYALEALLLTGALHAALRFRATGQLHYLLIFGLVAGFAAPNHPAIAAAVLLPAAIVTLRSSSISLKRVGLASTFGVLGLTSLAFLPVRALADPALNWGAPSTLGRFLWTVSGRAFHKTASADHISSFGQDFSELWIEVGKAATIPLALLAVAGLLMALRQRRQVTTALTLASIAVLSILIRAKLGFDAETPDHHGYVLPAVASLILLGIMAIAFLIRQLEDAGPPSALAAPGAAMALALLASVQFLSNVQRSSLSGARASDRLAQTMTAELPPRALVLSAYFETRFQLYATSEVFGARPDVVVLDRSFLTYPGAMKHEQRRHPELSDLIGAPLRANAPTPLALLDKQTLSRAVLVELHPNVTADLRRRLAPFGAFAMYLTERTAAMRPRIEALDAQAMKRLTMTARTDVPFDGERAMLSFIWRDFLRLALLCELGRIDAARLTYSRVIELAPGDESLAALASECQLESQ